MVDLAFKCTLNSDKKNTYHPPFPFPRFISLPLSSFSPSICCFLLMLEKAKAVGKVEKGGREGTETSDETHGGVAASVYTVGGCVCRCACIRKSACMRKQSHSSVCLTVECGLLCTLPQMHEKKMQFISSNCVCLCVCMCINQRMPLRCRL